MSTDDVFPGVLRCAEPIEYHEWLGGDGPVPARIVNPLRRFCFAAPDDWCREQRAAGRCHITDEQFRIVAMRHRTQALHEESEDMVTRPERTAPVRRNDVPAPVSNGVAAKPAIVWKAWTLGTRGTPTVAICTTGQLQINAVGDEELGKPIAVQLLWNDSPRMIGLRSVAKDAQGAIVAGKRAANGSFRVQASGFLRYHGVDFSEGRTWQARLIEGALAIELDTEPLPKRGRGKAKAT